MAQSEDKTLAVQVKMDRLPDQPSFCQSIRKYKIKKTDAAGVLLCGLSLRFTFQTV